MNSNSTLLGLSCLPAGAAIVASTQSAAQLYSNIHGNTLHDIANTFIANGAYTSQPVYITVGTGVAASSVNALSLTDGDTQVSCSPSGISTLADGTFGLYTYGAFRPGTLTVGETDCTIVCDYDGNSSVSHSYTLTGHTDAECTEKGSNTYTCSHCSLSYTDEIPALGHDWSALDGVCTRCDEVCAHSGTDDNICDICGAGIGGTEKTKESSYGNYGKVTIIGGTVKAIGGGTGGAGIKGGSFNESIKITGGSVYAAGSPNIENNTVNVVYPYTNSIYCTELKKRQLI